MKTLAKFSLLLLFSSTLFAAEPTVASYELFLNEWESASDEKRTNIAVDWISTYKLSEKGFQKIFGEEQGALLYSRARAAYEKTLIDPAEVVASKSQAKISHVSAYFSRATPPDREIYLRLVNVALWDKIILHIVVDPFAIGDLKLKEGYESIQSWYNNEGQKLALTGKATLDNLAPIKRILGTGLLLTEDFFVKKFGSKGKLEFQRLNQIFREVRRLEFKEQGLPEDLSSSLDTYIKDAAKDAAPGSKEAFK